MNIFPGRNEVTITLVILCVCIGLIIGLSVTKPDEGINFLLTGVPTLIGAFLGAWFAFRFERRKEELRISQNQFEAINRAIFLLGRFLNQLEVIRRQGIDPYRERTDVFLAMMPMLTQSYDDFRFDIKSLSFILETESPDILHDLLIEEARFHEAMNAMTHRSKLHLEKVQPVLEAFMTDPEKLYPIEEIEKELGVQLTTMIKQATDEVVHAFDRAIPTIQDLIDELTRKAIKWFPGKRVISPKLPE